MVSITSGKRSGVISLSSKIIVGAITFLLLATLLLYSIVIMHIFGSGSVNNNKSSNDKIFVISLQGTPNADPHNEGRLDVFKNAWKMNCGGTVPKITHCPGVMDARRGYGLTLSLLNCFQVAKTMGLDVTMIFEDDARLFDRESSLNFCSAEKRKSKVWAGLPEDAFIAFLGGHEWKYAEDPNDGDVGGKGGDMGISRFVRTQFSYGAYGFAVPRQSLDQLLETIKEDLAHGFLDENGVRHTEFLSPVKSWYRRAALVNKKIYAVHPLAVWHEGEFFEHVEEG